MTRALLAFALVIASCARDPIVRHPDGTFEDTRTHECFRYVGAGVNAWLVTAHCPAPRYRR